MNFNRPSTNTEKAKNEERAVLATAISWTLNMLGDCW